MTGPADVEREAIQNEPRLDALTQIRLDGTLPARAAEQLLGGAVSRHAFQETIRTRLAFLLYFLGEASAPSLRAEIQGAVARAASIGALTPSDGKLLVWATKLADELLARPVPEEAPHG